MIVIKIRQYPTGKFKKNTYFPVSVFSQNGIPNIEVKPCL